VLPLTLTCESQMPAATMSFRARRPLRLRVQGKIAENSRKIICLLDRPQRLKDGVRPLLWPSLADIAAEFPLDVGAAHRPADESGHVVDLADDTTPIGEDGGQASRHLRGASAGREGWVLHHRGLSREG